MKQLSEVSRTDADEVLRRCPGWYHSIELAPGIVTPGRAPLEYWNASWRSLQLPDIRGKSVLDIGAYDGFFSFAAERAGAGRVVALDYYVWSTDMTAYFRDREESKRTGVTVPPQHESRHWRPDELPGRRPFDAVHGLFASQVEPVVGDFLSMDLRKLGRFDVVLFMGVLYHMEDPLRALRRVASLTAPDGLAVIETEAMEITGVEDRPLCEFFPGAELNHDPTNWWAPNAKALAGICAAAGFRNVKVLTPPPASASPGRAKALLGMLAKTWPVRKLGVGMLPSAPLRYRAYAHASF